MRRGLAIAVASLALVAAGCGGNDEEDIRQVMTQLSKSDPAVCDKLTAKFIKDQFTGGAGQCKKAAEKAKADANIKVDSVKVDGDKATAQVSSQGQKATASFVKDGDWKLDGIK